MKKDAKVENKFSANKLAKLDGLINKAKLQVSQKDSKLALKAIEW